MNEHENKDEMRFFRRSLINILLQHGHLANVVIQLHTIKNMVRDSELDLYGQEMKVYG